MSTRSMFSFVSVAFTLVALTGCGGSSTTPLQQGYTACGSVTCSPGQNCANPSLSVCEEGCISDANCLSGQTCDPNGFPTRICIGSSLPDAGVPQTDGGTDTLAACRAACEHFQTCGLAAAEAAQCRTDCATLTEDQRAAIAVCGDTACTSVTSCLGVQCLSSDDCGPGAEECLNYQCL